MRLSENNHSPDNRIMLFDLATGGHHPNYIRHLVEYWSDNTLPGYLYVVVSPQFIEEHTDITAIASNYYQKNIKFVPINEDEYSDLMRKKNFVAKIFKEWSLLCKYSKNLRASQCLIMYFDYLQLPLVLGINSPCSVSGIYFRPTFHYDKFDGYVPSWKERLRQWRQKLLLRCVLQNSKFKTLFCLDPFAKEYIEKFSPKAKILYLPDPVRKYDNDRVKVGEFKAGLGIYSNRRVFLLFGRLESRKGTHQLLKSIELLPSNICENICLLIAGSMPPSEKLLLKTRMSEITQSLPVQIVIRDSFIPESEVQHYFESADVILAPYQRHVGMSGILLLAAAAQKPVLASNYGLIGEITRQYELGLAVDSTEPYSLAQGLIYLFHASPEKLCNLEKMRQFAQQNNPEQFSMTIFSHLD